MMTVGELRALIEGLDDSVEVRMAVQPSYPHEHQVSNLKLVRPNQADVEQTEEDIAGGELSPEEVLEARAHLAKLLEVPEVLYVAQGSWIGYGSSDAWAY